MSSSKYFCIQIHTERLHDDNVWRQAQKILGYFSKHNANATWFSVNPSFIGYKAMQFDENKWIERLRAIKEHGQDIQQHTHFYKGVEGKPKGEGYDMSMEHIEKRFQEDKLWLENRGLRIYGFASGAWRVNDDVFKALNKYGYKYDSSARSGKLEMFKDVLEIPVSSRVRHLVKDILMFKLARNYFKVEDKSICVLSFHDYDLGSIKFRSALFFVLAIFRIMDFDFISTSDLYGKLQQRQ